MKNIYLREDLLALAINRGINLNGKGYVYTISIRNIHDNERITR